MSTETAGGAAPARITSAEAIPLAYALTARVAAENDIRLIGIKGVVLAHHELRDPRISADIDMLLHPDDGERFVSAMEAIGWRRPPEADAPRLRRAHAINLVNDHWPIGVDLHVRFPGFLAPDAEVFEELWTRRVALTQAASPMWATDAAGSAAIAALHYLRERHVASNQTALDKLVDKSSARFDAAGLVDLRDFASVTGSTRTLTPYLERLGVTPGAEHPDEAREWPAWKRASEVEMDTFWWTVLRGAHPRKWPGILWRVLMPDEERLRNLYARDVASPLWTLRVARFRHILSRIPNVLSGRSKHRD